MIRITKVTTKTGDKGSTRLATGESISKSSPRIDAIGDLDELNAALGLAAAFMESSSEQSDLLTRIKRLQNELFDIGGKLSVKQNKGEKQDTQIIPTMTKRLEDELNAMNRNLPALNSFVLPGGSKAAAHIHLARTICRRAERTLVSLSEDEVIDTSMIPYLNRLSDWLFVAARYVTHQAGDEERLWKIGVRH